MMIPHTIDPARVDITPAALVERLRQAECQLGGDGYLCACALYQIWCDLSLLAEASHQPLALRRQIRCAMNHAQLNVMSIACGHNASSTPASYPSLTLTLQGQMAPWLELLTRILSTPLPECYGYDLGDTEVCMADAGRFAREQADGHPLVIVGIRSGGSIVAPRWVAGVAKTTQSTPPWLTVRPLRQQDTSCRYHPAELATLLRLCDALPDRPNLLIVDDKPDTGRTVSALVSVLADKVNGLWFASIGHVSKIAAPEVWTTQFSHSPLVARERRPLWQLLLAQDHAAFLATLAAALPETASVGAGARVVIHCPALEKRYGTGEAWLPWNAPAMARSRLRRINPRKTPLLITDPSGNPLMHLRFIGENAYGLAEFGRLKQVCAASAQAAFMDGYHITQHLHGLRPLRALLAHANGSERRRWLLQSRHSIENISHPPLARVAGQRSRVPIGEMLNRLWQRLQTRMGQEPAPALPSWLCSLTIPPFGGSLRPIRSSLRYAWGEWHWQGDAEAGLHRFHQNANWGDVSWPELEIAAFLLVHHLPFETLHLMDDDKHYAPPTVDIVAASLPAAACVILSGINREVRQFSARGKARLREDLSLLAQQLIRYRENILAGTRPGAPAKQA
ncbi:putative, antibiotic synthase (plasmid) [Sodalis praecaptivus]|uniref:Putative, antibiotic synthase n=1 Tax=Sodalis praecaptivus TaxID=1239307 RepID=W0I4G2_9GAMM|nr:hypothetical protein [Sodalis praecaptivus]AHF79350.1 putative, antibiotic synthase [Sodalis praecaptivus]